MGRSQDRRIDAVLAAATAQPSADTQSHDSNLQFIMSLAQAVSESNPDLQAVLGVQQPQYSGGPASTTHSQPPTPTSSQAQMFLRQLQKAQPTLAQDAKVVAHLAAQGSASAPAAVTQPTSAGGHGLTKPPLGQPATAPPTSQAKPDAVPIAMGSGGAHTGAQDARMPVVQDTLNAHQHMNALTQTAWASKAALASSLYDGNASLAHMIAQQSAALQHGANPRVGSAYSADLSPGTLPAAGAEESLDAYLDDASLLIRIAQHVPKIVSKELPNPGESSAGGSSDVWVQLKQKDLDGKLGGISSHQGSSTSAPLAFPRLYLHARHAHVARSGRRPCCLPGRCRACAWVSSWG